MALPACGRAVLSLGAALAGADGALVFTAAGQPIVQREIQLLLRTLHILRSASQKVQMYRQIHPPAASNPPIRSHLAQLSPGSSLGAGAALSRLQRVVDGQLALEDTRRVRATPAERPGGETYGRGAPPEFASAAAGTTSERRLCSQNRSAAQIPRF